MVDFGNGSTWGFGSVFVLFLCVLWVGGWGLGVVGLVWLCFWSVFGPFLQFICCSWRCFLGVVCWELLVARVHGCFWLLVLVCSCFWLLWLVCFVLCFWFLVDQVGCSLVGGFVVFIVFVVVGSSGSCALFFLVLSFFGVFSLVCFWCCFVLCVVVFFWLVVFPVALFCGSGFHFGCGLLRVSVLAFLFCCFPLCSFFWLVCCSTFVLFFSFAFLVMVRPGISGRFLVLLFFLLWGRFSWLLWLIRLLVSS